MPVPAHAVLLGSNTAAGVAFSPDDIANLEVWLKADGTLWEDSAGTTPAATDGDPVRRWDNDGSGADFLAPSDATRPLYETNIQNGLPVVRFDGGDDILTATVGADASRTIFAAMVKRSALSASSKTALALGTSNAAQLFGNSGTGSGWCWFSNQAAGVSVLSTTAPTTFHVVCLRISSTSVLKFWHNGGAGTSIDPADAVSSNTTFSLAGYSASVNPCDVDHGEIIAYTDALSDAEVDDVGDYLAARWGTTWTAVS